MDKVIIVAPHSKCVDPNRRDCDTRAKSIAQKIYNISVEKGFDTELFLSDELRENFDLNRAESRDTHWRRHLEDLVLKYYRDPKIRHIWILEMHSFPRKQWESNNDEKMALVSIPEFARAGISLAKFMNSKNFYIYQGTDKNDIQYTYAPFRDKVTVFLLESCEDSDYFSDSELDGELIKIIDFVDQTDGTNSNVPTWIMQKTKYEVYMRILIAVIIILIVFIIFNYFLNVQTNGSVMQYVHIR